MEHIGLRERAGIVARHCTRLALASLAASVTACGSDYNPAAVVPSVATVSVAPTPTALIVGGTHQFTATLRDASGTELTGRVVSWSTSDTTKARVNGSGLVTAIADGAVQIIAMSERKQGIAQATAVTLPVASIAMTPLTASVQVGRTQQLTARLLSNTGAELPGQRPITWTSSDATIATVDVRGLVTAVKTGAAVITARCEGQSATAQLTVTP